MDAASADGCTACTSESPSRKLRGFDFWQQTLRSARYIVAPMVDQSELAWRMLSRKYCAELCYTPMLHASVFVRDASYRAEHLVTCPGDRPLIVQFCANDPETLLQAGLLAQDVCDAVDLNLGCPQTIAKKGHYGAFLQDEWELLERMISLCHRQLSVPITCKIRIFDDVNRTVAYARMLERAGCQLLTVHGRTLLQKGANTGLASWMHIKAVRDNVKIPVFANGNIQNLADVKRCLEETGAQGVMIAEGSLHIPALFTGKEFPVWQVADEYLEMVDKYPCQLSAVRGHMFKIFHHSLCLYTDLRDLLGACHDVQGIREVSRKLKERLQADAAAADAAGGYKGSLPTPHWICQPYIRPDPDSVCQGDVDATTPVANEKVSQRDRKRMCMEMRLAVLPEDALSLSKNKQKKLLRYPNKKFEGKQARNYQICSKCNAHAKGTRCIHQFCKLCCHKESVDCAGHNFAFGKKAAPSAMKLDVQQHDVT